MRNSLSLDAALPAQGAAEVAEDLILLVGNDTECKARVANALAQALGATVREVTKVGVTIYTRDLPNAKPIVIDTVPLKVIDDQRSIVENARQWVSRNSLRRLFGRNVFVVVIGVIDSPHDTFSLLAYIFAKHEKELMILLTPEYENEKTPILRALKRRGFSNRENIQFVNLLKEDLAQEINSVVESLHAGRGGDDETKGNRTSGRAKPFLLREVTPNASNSKKYGPWGPENVLLFGRTGSGKSTLAQMLTRGKLDFDSMEFSSGSGVRGITKKICFGYGRGWSVVDTPGFGGSEYNSTISTDKTYRSLKAFLKRVEGTYTHFLYTFRKGRLEVLEESLWRLFRVMFGEETVRDHATVVISDADDEWVNANISALNGIFKGCESFVSADFPSFFASDPVIEDDLQVNRELSLRALEDELASRCRFDISCELGMWSIGTQRSVFTLAENPAIYTMWPVYEAARLFQRGRSIFSNLISRRKKVDLLPSDTPESLPTSRPVSYTTHLSGPPDDDEPSDTPESLSTAQAVSDKTQLSGPPDDDEIVSDWSNVDGRNSKELATDTGRIPDFAWGRPPEILIMLRYSVERHTWIPEPVTVPGLFVRAETPHPGEVKHDRNAEGKFESKDIRKQPVEHAGSVVEMITSTPGNLTSAEDLIRDVEERREDGYFVSYRWLFSLEENQRTSLMFFFRRAGYSETYQSSLTILFEKLENDSQNQKIDDNAPSLFAELDAGSQGADDLLGRRREGLNIGNDEENDVELSPDNGIERNMQELLGPDPANSSFDHFPAEPPGAEALESLISALESRTHGSYLVSTRLQDPEKNVLEQSVLEAGFAKIYQTSNTQLFERVQGDIGHSSSNQYNPANTSRIVDVGGNKRQGASESEGSTGFNKISHSLEDGASGSTSVPDTSTERRSEAGNCNCRPQRLKVSCVWSSSDASLPSAISSRGHFKRIQFGESFATLPKREESFSVTTTVDKCLSMDTVEILGERDGSMSVLFGERGGLASVGLKATATTTLSCCLKTDTKRVRVELSIISGNIKNKERGQNLRNNLALSSLRTNIDCNIYKGTEPEEQIVLKIENEDKRVLQSDLEWLALTGDHPDGCESGSTTLELQGNIKGRLKADLEGLVPRAHVLHFQEEPPMVLVGKIPLTLHPELFLEFKIKYQLEYSYLKPFTPIPEQDTAVRGRRTTELVDFECCFDLTTILYPPSR